jgi:hypothetical protein
MRSPKIALFALALLPMAICACNNAPGRPPADSESTRPNKVLGFDTLYQQNCAGCHGEQGRGGAALHALERNFRRRPCSERRQPVITPAEISPGALELSVIVGDVSVAPVVVFE